MSRQLIWRQLRPQIWAENRCLHLLEKCEAGVSGGSVIFFKWHRSGTRFPREILASFSALKCASSILGGGTGVPRVQGNVH